MSKACASVQNKKTEVKPSQIHLNVCILGSRGYGDQNLW